MKKLLILLISLSVLAISCKKDEENNDPDFAMQAKIDGVDFKTSSVSQAVHGESMQVSAFDGDRTIQLFMPDNTTPCTYDFGIGEVTGYFEDTSIPISVTSNSGTIIITAIDPDNARFQATFNIIVTEFGGGTSVSVTEGKVDYDY